MPAASPQAMGSHPPAGWFRHVVLGYAIPSGLCGLLGTALASHLFNHDWHEFLTAAVTMFVVAPAYGAVAWIANERTYPKPYSPSQDYPP
jgi:hypothetical protein